MNKGNLGWPIIVEEKETPCRKKPQRILDAEKTVAERPASFGVYIPGLEHEENEQLEKVIDREWKEQHAKIDDYKKRFIPNPGWVCSACHVNLNNKPRPECTSDRHQNYYAIRHPRYKLVSGKNSTS